MSLSGVVAKFAYIRKQGERDTFPWQPETKKVYLSVEGQQDKDSSFGINTGVIYQYEKSFTS